MSSNAETAPSNRRSLEESRKVLRDCFPDFKFRRIEPVANPGADSDVFIVEKEWIFRIARRPEVISWIKKEIALLPKLAPTLPAAVPNFEFTCPEKGIVGYQTIEGSELSQELINSVEPRLIGNDMGRFLKALHEFPTDKAHALGAPFDHGAGSLRDARFAYSPSWRGWVSATCDRFREVAAPYLPFKARRTAETLISAVLDDQEAFSFEPVLVHTEINPDHVLCTDEGRLAGVIDWSDCAIGDPAVDLAWLITDTSPDFAASLLAGYERPLDAAFHRRVKLYMGVLWYFGGILHTIERNEPALVSRALEGMSSRLRKLERN